MRRNSKTGVYAILESLLKRRWFLCILRQLEKGQSSVDMISRSVPEMPVHLLNGRLRTLLRYGLISRCSRQLAFQNVEYRLTRFGKKITEIVDRLDELDLEFGSVMPVGDVRDPADLGQGEEVAGPMNGKAKAQELMSGSENRPERKLLKVPAENPLCDAKVTEK